MLLESIMDNSKAFHAPLHPEDNQEQTLGCRHMNPDTCSKHSLVDVCAFVREDGLCLRPPKSWPKHYQNLLGPQD